MRKKLIIALLVFALIFTIALSKIKKKQPLETYSNNGINFSSKIEGNRFQVLKDGKWQDIVVKGVNMGITSPSSEEFITKDAYQQWFKYIGEMNANAIRIHTIHPPDFYKELKKYNEKHDNKIYLFQGVSIDGEILEETLDAFKLDNIVPFKEEITKTIDVIHGSTTLPDRPGHAGGKYTADVSPYVIGWILGMEWSPSVVDNMNKSREDKGDYSGNFVYTEGAQPFENWLADVMDHTLTYEMEQYHWQRPISFTNWIMTDMIKQPYALENEDLAGINPNTIKLKNIETGYFASYHIYPFYPDFLNTDPKYTKHMDYRGKPNNFAGYLQNLIALHEVPPLVTEFGVSSSRGTNYVNIHGWNQGFLSEDEQGNIVANLFEDIIQEGYLGGIISSWQDEWQGWSNAQRGEEQFGLLSFDRHKIKIDGSKTDWTRNKAEPIFTMDKKEINKIKNVYMDHDERYLYFGIEYKDLNSEALDTLIFLDTNSNQGNTTNPYNSNIVLANGAEFIIQIRDQDSSNIVVDGYYDIHYYQYGKTLKMLPTNSTLENMNSGIFNPIKLALNKEVIMPKTKQKTTFVDYETGILRLGNGNPESNEYDSLTDYAINKKENFIEIRVPWELIGFTDPSTREILGNLHVDGLEARKNIEGIKVAIATYGSQTLDNLDTFPKLNDPVISDDDMYLYTWENWSHPVIEERLKKSYFILKEKFSKY